jgi:hypothetical protein
MAGPIRATAARAPSASSRQPPRPLNAWILYRKAKLAELLKEEPELKRQPQAELSKRISRLWKEESDEIRTRYEYEANVHKTQHQEQYPDYQFRPQKRAEKERMREERRVEKEKERKQQQRRIRNMSQSSARQPSVPTTPAPSSILPPVHDFLAELANTNPSEFHTVCTNTYGPYGPSPPVSQCPSPNGSPVSRPRSLPVSSESERSQSRPPHSISTSITPSTYQLSPLELISALHNASTSPDVQPNPQEKKPQPDAPTSPDVISPSWAQPQEQAGPSGHAPSLATAGPSGFAAPDASVTQGGNGFTAGALWPAPSAQEVNGADARQDANGSAKDGYSETYGHEGHEGQGQQSIVSFFFCYLFSPSFLVHVSRLTWRPCCHWSISLSSCFCDLPQNLRVFAVVSSNSFLHPHLLQSQPNGSVKMDGMNSQWTNSFNVNETYFNYDTAPLQGQLASTGVEDVFALTIPTASLGEGPPGEIEIQTGNFFGQYQQQFEGAAGGSDAVQQNMPTVTNDQLGEYQMFLQQFGVPMNNVYDNHDLVDGSTIMDSGVTLSETPPNLTMDPIANLHEHDLQGSSLTQNSPTPQTPSSTSDMQSHMQPLSAVERDLGMEPFVFPQDMQQHGIFALPTPPSTVSPTAYMSFSQIQSNVPSPSYIQVHDFDSNANKTSHTQQQQQLQNQHRPHSSWGYHIAHPQVQFQSQTQEQTPSQAQPQPPALATPSPSPRVPATHSRRTQQPQQPRMNALVAGATAGMHRASVAMGLFPGMQLSDSPAPNANANVPAMGMGTNDVNAGVGAAKENEMSGSTMTMKNAQVPAARKVANQWRVARSS